METLEEIKEFVSGTAKKFDCKILTRASSISMHDNFVQIKIEVEGKAALYCYECICTIFQRYYYKAILRSPPKVWAERDFETDNVHYQGSLRFMFNPAEQSIYAFSLYGLRGLVMEDIVERLRNVSEVELHEPLCMEAADEIERLREALQKIAAVEDEYINPPTTPSEANLWGIIDGCVRVAEKALGGK